LDPHYKISEALLNGNKSSQTELQSHKSPVGETNQMICMICGQTKKTSNKMTGQCSGSHAFLNNNAIDKLVSIIKKKLVSKSCSFP
jgi:hypothetical protein